MPITGPEAERIKKEIARIRSGAESGDFMRRPGQRGIGQAEQRMIRNLSLRLLTPEERIEHDKREAEAAAYDRRAKALRSVFKSTKTETLDKNRFLKAGVSTYMASQFKDIEKLRLMTLDDDNPDQWLLFHRAIPMMYHRGEVLGKFRFKWGPDGKPVYVPWTQKSWENFFRHPQRGRWIPNQPFMYKCTPAWEDHWIKKYTDESRRQATYGKYQGRGDKRKVWQHTIGAAICKKPKKSLWVKIRKGVAVAVAVVAAVYLGPAALTFVQNAASAATGGLIPAAGGGAGAGAGAGGAAAAAGGGGSSAVAAATTSQKILSGAKTLVGYVNKARTIKAVVKGEMPPPPIGVGGATFGQWAMIVAKEEIKKAAMDKAMEEGVKYIEKKMTEKEEAKIRAEIAELQRQILAATPPEVKKMPPEPMPELAAPIKKIQAIEVEKKHQLDQFIIPAALVGGALMFV